MKRPWTKQSEQTPWNPKPENKPFSGSDRHAYHEVHNTRRWQGIRKAYLAKNPLCERCKLKNKIKSGEVVDHIIPIQDGGEAWDWSNLQTLCKRCHAIKTNQEINKRKNEYKYR